MRLYSAIFDNCFIELFDNYLLSFFGCFPFGRDLQSRPFSNSISFSAGFTIRLTLKFASLCLAHTTLQLINHRPTQYSKYSQALFYSQSNRMLNLGHSLCHFSFLEKKSNQKKATTNAGPLPAANRFATAHARVARSVRGRPPALPTKILLATTLT